MKVLVTGANGLIGPYACQKLISAGHDVITCGRTVPEDGELPGRHVTGDLLDASFRKHLIASERPDGLIHLAWQTKHGHFWNAPDNPDWSEASIDLLDRFHEQGGKRAVLAGSCAEYDWQGIAPGQKLTEDATCNPHTIYGQEKLKLARHCLDLNAKGAAIAWGRLFLLCGPKEAPARFVPAITRALLAGETAKMSSGKQIRDFMHVADASAAFAKLIDHPFTGLINIASGEGHSLLDVAETIKSLIGRGTIAAGSIPDRPDDPPYLVPDTSTLTQTVGFRREFDLQAALENCIEWWQSHPA
ncbi:MAG: NAD-dependent dehydratase [Thalassospira sp.]|uniref:NAD-dependent epimerase/dehydratase family protein n=1 Tax=Thalassospira sp. UBA4513 TaxID=1947675 RepID=UPI000C5E2E60|nr:NAD(P)-dependent oxidoreductase [Thalassospira sp. UBA4513]MBE69372.1 NAD-dependent dehydratase [Thalassospira sp.]|tara:strand:- start:381 stop:1286 length:906 start_codon:yes stop_codon:yes gene_type:complete